MDDSKLKEIVDFALAERIKKLEQLCNDHSQRNNDLTRRFGQQETLIANLERELVIECSNHATCVNERNTLRARVAELESITKELEAVLTQAREDRDRIHRVSCDRAHRIDAARAALES